MGTILYQNTGNKNNISRNDFNGGTQNKNTSRNDFDGKMILMEKWSSVNLVKNLWLFIYSKFSNEDTLVPASWGPWALLMSEVKMAMPVLRCEPNDQMALKYVETSVLVARKAFLAGFSI